MQTVLKPFSTGHGVLSRVSCTRKDVDHRIIGLQLCRRWMRRLKSVKTHKITINADDQYLALSGIALFLHVRGDNSMSPKAIEV